jgi:hypothetical protein
MSDVRKVVHELSAEARLHLRARELSERTSVRLHTIAVYSSLALIAAIVFGAISAPPL